MNNIESIGVIEKNGSRHTKKDQKHAKIVKRFQHAPRFPSDDKIMHSSLTTRVKNNVMTRRDVEVSQDMLGPSKCATQ